LAVAGTIAAVVISIEALLIGIFSGSNGKNNITPPNECWVSVPKVLVVKYRCKHYNIVYAE